MRKLTFIISSFLFFISNSFSANDNCVFYRDYLRACKDNFASTDKTDFRKAWLKKINDYAFDKNTPKDVCYYNLIREGMAIANTLKDYKTALVFASIMVRDTKDFPELYNDSYSYIQISSNYLKSIDAPISPELLAYCENVYMNLGLIDNFVSKYGFLIEYANLALEIGDTKKAIQLYEELMKVILGMSDETYQKEIFQRGSKSLTLEYNSKVLFDLYDSEAQLNAMYEKLKKSGRVDVILLAQDYVKALADKGISSTAMSELTGAIRGQTLMPSNFFYYINAAAYLSQKGYNADALLFIQKLIAFSSQDGFDGMINMDAWPDYMDFLKSLQTSVIQELNK